MPTRQAGGGCGGSGWRLGAQPGASEATAVRCRFRPARKPGWCVNGRPQGQTASARAAGWTRREQIERNTDPPADTVRSTRGTVRITEKCSEQSTAQKSAFELLK